MELAPVQRFYRYQAAIYDLTRWTILLGRYHAAELLHLRPDSQVLEIGCGTGLNFLPILKRISADQGRLVGVDFSTHMLAKARRRIERKGWQNVELQEADATRLDLGQQFDRVFFAYSLSMIPGWQGALERAAAHLKPDGRLVVLDFGCFRRWGPFAPPMRTFLRLNHVSILQGVDSALREHCGNVKLHSGLGGHHIIAVGENPACTK